MITSSTPPPRPLQVGEHVLCTLCPSSTHNPIHAVVVALDKTYEEAASHFLATTSCQSPKQDHGASPGKTHVIDSAGNSDQEVQPVPNPHSPAIDSDDELHMYPVDQASTRIVFREAHSRPRRSYSAYQSRNRRRRPQVPTTDDTPAPHPITNGRVYLHFSGRDRRLDRWAIASEVQRASASHVAAAASDVVANRLLNDEVHPDIVAATANATHEPKLTRARRRAYEQINPTSEKEIGNEAISRMEKAREESTKIRNVSTIVFGNYSIDAWYFSPFPLKDPVEFLYMCGKCLMYVRTCRKFVQHCTKCEWTDVPGLLIYEDTTRSLRVFEVSGVINPDYCQRLCLLGKLFLDHKTLFFDVTPFIFYIVTVGGDLAGFFSKEHHIIESIHNVACIVTLPPHQKKGIGRFLISLSYELTKREGKTGSPERPLSDLGQLSYRSYWAFTIAQYLQSTRSEFDKIPAAKISEVTGISCLDVIETLKSLDLVYMWRGETNADVSSKALDAALQKVSEPRLPFRFQCLKQVKTSLKMDINDASPLSTPLTPGTPGSRRRTRSRDRHTRKLGRNFLYTPEQLPEMSEGTKEYAHQKIKRFMRQHGRARVEARLNSPHGLTSHQVRKLCDEVDMSLKQCRKVMRRLIKEEDEPPTRVVEGQLNSQRNRLDVSQDSFPGFEGDSFMLETSISRGRSLPSGTKKTRRSLSERGEVNFVDRTQVDVRESRLKRHRTRTRQASREMDVVVIDS